MLSENNTRWASVVTYENIIEKKTITSVKFFRENLL